MLVPFSLRGSTDPEQTSTVHLEEKHVNMREVEHAFWVDKVTHRTHLTLTRPFYTSNVRIKKRQRLLPTIRHINVDQGQHFALELTFKTIQPGED